MNLISYKEAAKLFPGATPKKISQWLYHKILPPDLRISIGKSRFLDKDGLEEFIETKRG